MSLLNLTLAELLAVFLPIGAAVVALYLYDRAHRRQVVSTLRFLRPVSRAPVFTRRKKIQQPWSLVLQLAAMALLLLAIAEPQLGRRAERTRDHVLILETSAWMHAADRSPAARRAPGTLMQVAQQRALEYVRAVPPQDRVMLIRADQLATPATSFTQNHKDLESAVRASAAGSTALNLSAALELARSLQRMSSGATPGEVVLVGSGRAMRADLQRVASAEMPRLRTILLGGEPDNCGLRKLAARRLADDPFTWQIEVGAYNYGAEERRATLELRFAGSRVASKMLVLHAHASTEASFQFRPGREGPLEAVLDSKDDYRADNRATIELPKLTPLKIQVFTPQPQLWQALLTASPLLNPEFFPPARYTPSGPPHRLVIVDGFQPSGEPDADLIWIAPPGPAGRRAAGLHLSRWNATHPVAAGLHNKDVQVSKATLLHAGASEVAVAESERGAVLVAAGSGRFKKLIFGFHPLEEGMQNHVAIPLLFANLVRWVSPDLFRAAEVSAATPGLIELETPPGTRREQVQVTSEQIRGLSFTMVGNRLRFFAGQAGTVRVSLPEREVLYALNLPEVGEARWTPPPEARRGVPPAGPVAPLQRDLWPWLAAAGVLTLLLEWALYGRQPRAAVPVGRPAPPRLSFVPEAAPPAAEPAGQGVQP